MQDGDELTPRNLLFVHFPNSSEGDRYRLYGQRVANVLLHEEIHLRDLRPRHEDDIEWPERKVDTGDYECVPLPGTPEPAR
jgi:hypothetical protein